MKIKLTKLQLQALLSATVGWEPNKDQNTIACYCYSDSHNDLLLEHQFDFALFLGKYLPRERKAYNINFTSLQALAFMQMWVGRPLPPFPLEQAVITLVIGLLDKEHKQVKILQHETIAI